MCGGEIGGEERSEHISSILVGKRRWEGGVKLDEGVSREANLLEEA